jgi:multicomponent Na+:H+ antiporter subunit B
VYVESPVIMTTVQLIAPFAMTYGLFLLFHGADTPGGSFQGGAIIGASVLMIAFAFGIDVTREWLRNRTVVALAAGGTAAFAMVGIVPVILGGNFLEYGMYEEAFGIKAKWGLEAIEILGVAPIVAGVVCGLFFAIAAGYLSGADTWDSRDGSNSHSEPTTTEVTDDD